MPCRHVKPHKFIIHGHPTSVRLERQFWYLLRMIAAEHGMTVRTFIEAVHAATAADRPLSSALRLAVVDYFYRQYDREGYIDPDGRSVFSVEKPRRRRRRSSSRTAPAGSALRV
jgi:predicted DNA-binding ribbon-helix-helix protein